MNSITIEEVKELPKDSYQLIDIRDAESIAHGSNRSTSGRHIIL